MKKLLMVAFMASLAATQTVHAGQQNTPADKAQKPGVADKGSVKPTTITGCVAESGTVYRLDHAIVAVDIDTDTQNRPGTEASATPKMMSYILVGGDVKAHVGHKVEVTGTLSGDKTSKQNVGIKGAPGMELSGTLNVKSVKMVSAMCP
jgi:hypothetical protein